MPSPAKPTVKQERELRRAEKVAAMKKQMATQRRRQRIGLISGIVAGVAVLAVIITFVVTSSIPRQDPDDIEIEGLKEFPGITATHVTTAVDYEADYDMSPPAGGNHNAAWLNCGVYDQVQQNENAVHALEHGAVWVTYNADVVSGSDLDALRSSLPSTYIILSPYDDLQAPVVASAWGAQVELDGVDDPRLAEFITKYWKSASAPEPGASCTGAISGPGLVS